RDEWVNEIIHPDDRPMMRIARESLLASAHDRREEEYRIVRPDGEVRWVVNRARRVMRHGRQMIYGISIDVTDRVRTEAALRSAAIEGRASACEFRVVWPDGTVRWLASRSTPIRDSSGQSTRYIGVNWDITERVSAETARREKIVAQRESEAKSQFLARMSH